MLNKVRPVEESFHFLHIYLDMDYFIISLDSIEYLWQIPDDRDDRQTGWD